MTKLFKTVLLLTAILTTSTASARVWRVNPNPNSGAEYQNFDVLMNNFEFEEGDTIVCDPGNYGTQTISRKNIKVFGPGYLLNQNYQDTNINETSSAKFETIYVRADGISISGLEASEIVTAISAYWATFASNNINIDKCQVNKLSCAGGGKSSSDCQVTRCLINSGITCPATGLVANNIIYDLNAKNVALVGLGSSKNCTFRNNTVVLVNDKSYNTIISSPQNCNMYDNIFLRVSTIADSNGNPLCASGILDYEVASTNNFIFYNNVLSSPEKFSSDLYPNNHYVNATLENTFVWEGSEDGKFRLKEGSPAKGASSNGGDCGAFGGALPYVLSGVPAFMPRITNASVPDSPTDGKISVTLTIKTQNE